MASQSAQHLAPDGAGKRIHIITICMLCAGVLLLLLAVRSGINLVQLHVLGHETRGRVIRQEIRIEERRVGSKGSTKRSKRLNAIMRSSHLPRMREHSPLSRIRTAWENPPIQRTHP